MKEPRRQVYLQCVGLFLPPPSLIHVSQCTARCWGSVAGHCWFNAGQSYSTLPNIHALQITNRALLLAIRVLLLIIRALLLTIHALLLTIRALLLTIHALLLTIHAHVFDMRSTFIAQIASRPPPVLPLLDRVGDLSGRSKQCDIGLRPINYNIFRWLLNRRVSEC